ncbi:CBR-UNC-45 protein [Ditylenchus destructor]|nr:CBR-UNC-45 protein [Ditylenchus destructor]
MLRDAAAELLLNVLFYDDFFKQTIKPNTDRVKLWAEGDERLKVASNSGFATLTEDPESPPLRKARRAMGGARRDDVCVEEETQQIQPKPRVPLREAKGPVKRRRILADSNEDLSEDAPNEQHITRRKVRDGDGSRQYIWQRPWTPAAALPEQFSTAVTDAAVEEIGDLLERSHIKAEESPEDYGVDLALARQNSDMDVEEDSKADDVFSSYRHLIPNVIVNQVQYQLDSSGHNMSASFVECPKNQVD